MESTNKTKLIYFNEEDKPKLKNPLQFVDWCIEIKQVELESYGYTFSRLTDIELEEGSKYDLEQLILEYSEYRKNFEDNDKPIEFTSFYNGAYGKLEPTTYKPKNFDIVVYAGNGFFLCTDKGGLGTVSVFKGNLNSGKL